MGSRWNITMPFGVENLEWFGYPTVKKKMKKRLLVLTEFTRAAETAMEQTGSGSGITSL